MFDREASQSIEFRNFYFHSTLQIQCKYIKADSMPFDLQVMRLTHMCFSRPCLFLDRVYNAVLGSMTL